MKRLLSLIALLTMAFCSQTPAFASQNSTVLPTTSPYPGLTMLGNINSAFNTFQTQFSGSSAPSGATPTQLWADTSTNLLKFTPDGTNWYPMGYFNGGWTITSSGFKQIAVTSTGSTNHYVVAYSPAPVALVTGQKYSFVTNFQNTGAADVNFNSLGAVPLKKQGNVTLASGDVASGAVVECVYDGTNCQITSQLSQASTGTMTSIATSNGVCGGTITTAGTLSLCSINANTILANSTGSSAAPIGTSALPSGTTATTQAAGDNTIAVATDNFVMSAVIPIVSTVSSGIPPVDTIITFNHGLGVVPSRYTVSLHCITSEYGYAPGDEISMAGVSDGDGARYFGSWATTTQIGWIGPNQRTPNIVDRIGLSEQTISPANWGLVFRAWVN